MDDFKSEILNIDIGNIDDGTDINKNIDWNNLKKEYI